MFGLTQLYQKTRRAFGVAYEGPTEWPEDLPLVNTYAGERVTPATALRLTAVWACFRVLSETIGALPLHVIEETRDGQGRARRRPASDHPLYFLLHNEPNGEMDTCQWREGQVIDLCGFGNSYHFVDWGQWGEITGIYPLHATQVIQKRDTRRRIVYEVSTGDGRTTYPADRILRPMILPELTKDGLIGRSPIGACRQSIGLGLGAEQYGARLFANDARATGVIQIKGKLGKTREEAIRLKREMQQDWQEARGGNGRHKIAILDQEQEFKSITINPDDAQFLETRKFQISEIARIFRVPPHMIADLDKATFSNIEHQAIEFVVHTITPYLVKLEQAMSRSLLSREEKGRLRIRFNVDGLLRGDTASRYRAYAMAIQWGWMNPNEVRELEDRDPFEGGDEYLRPLNMVEVGAEPEQPADEPGGEKDKPAASRILHAYTGFCGMMGELMQREHANGNQHQ